MSKVWRAIVGREYWVEESAKSKRRSFRWAYAWSARPKVRLHLECGHTQVRSCGNDPKHKALCKRCEAGEPQTEPKVVGTHGPPRPQEVRATTKETLASIRENTFIESFGKS